MSYERALPGDAFNEANLLKCIGRLTLLIEDGLLPGLIYDYYGGPFEIEQNPSDGSLSISNIEFYLTDPDTPNDKNKNLLPIFFYRSLNSRDNWPLFEKETHEPVFDSEGNFIFDIKPFYNERYS